MSDAMIETDVFGVPVEESDPMRWLRARVATLIAKGMERHMPTIARQIARDGIPPRFQEGFTYSGVSKRVETILRAESDGTVVKMGRRVYRRAEELLDPAEAYEMLAYKLQGIQKDVAKAEALAEQFHQRWPDIPAADFLAHAQAMSLPDEDRAESVG